MVSSTDEEPCGTSNVTCRGTLALSKESTCGMVQGGAMNLRVAVFIINNVPLTEVERLCEVKAESHLCSQGSHVATQIVFIKVWQQILQPLWQQNPSGFLKEPHKRFFSVCTLFLFLNILIQRNSPLHPWRPGPLTSWQIPFTTPALLAWLPVFSFKLVKLLKWLSYLFLVPYFIHLMRVKSGDVFHHLLFYWENDNHPR